MPILSSVPAPLQYLDFAGDYYGGGALTDFVACSCASSRYITDSSGTMALVGPNIPRRSNLGMQIEEPRTNLVLRSQELDNAAWGKIAVTVTADADVAPDVTLTADRITGNGVDTAHFIRPPVNLATAAIATASMYMKQGTNRYGYYYTLGRSPTQDLSVVSYWDLQSGAVVAGSYAGSLIQRFQNNWFRSIIVTPGWSTATTTEVRPAITSASGLQNSTADGYVSMWGIQLEVGAFATSYIPTTSAAATRAAEVNTQALAGVAAGAVVVNARTALGAGTQTLWCWDDGTVNNRLRIYRDSSNNIHAVATSGGVDQADLNLGAVTADTLFKVFFAWSANDFAAVLNGGSAVTDSSGTVPTGLTTIRYGSDSAGNYWNGYMLRNNLYNSRVADAGGVVLTT